MRWEINHVTTYTFDRPVFLEPHHIRLRPRCDAAQRLLQFDLLIEPPPAGLAEFAEAEGNSVVRAWFDGVTDTLRLSASCAVETLRSNPFDFLSEPDGATLPPTYADDTGAALAPARAVSDCGEAVTRFAREVALRVGGRTQPFLDLLNGTIHGHCRVVIREEGAAQPPQLTLESGVGACRDLALLFMEACRSMGLAARFVSGYQAGDPEPTERYLHAWAEVYVPGGGWRGYDPTLGLSVADQHVALAGSFTPSLAAPVTGSFRGTGATSRMTYDLSIKTAT